MSHSSRQVTPAASKAWNVTRHIPQKVSEVLWGRSAGRCQFCNQPLWKSAHTQEVVKLAQRAHIYSFSDDGPRGNAGIDAEDLNNLPNLMLVCQPCHQKFDQNKDGGRYTVDLLRQLKENHERRVELVTGIVTDVHSHVLLYGANVGDHTSRLRFSDAAHAMFPDVLPASDQPIELSLRNSATADRDETFWSLQSAELRTHFARRVRDRLDSDTGAIKHLSVFALAPQPLLVLLGTLLGDIVPTRVHQRRREPPTWAWNRFAEPLELQIEEPATLDGIPALVLSLSATVTDDRIVRVLGPNVSIWRVTLPTPHNDVLQAEVHLAQWRRLLRPLLDRVKAEHGQTATLHIFPALPVSAAVELGRIRMPKADMPWQLYDQISARGGFIPALPISEEEK